MKLYLLTTVENWEPWYDKAFGFVVRAQDETSARTLASNNAGDEGSEAWMNPKLTACNELTPEGVPEVVIRDYVRS